MPEKRHLRRQRASCRPRCAPERGLVPKEAGNRRLPSDSSGCPSNASLVAYTAGKSFSTLSRKEKVCQHSKCLPDFPCNSASALQLEIGRKASDLAARASGGAAASTASLLQQLLPCACFWEWKGLQSVQVAFSLRWKAARSVPVFCSFFLHVSAASTLSVCRRSG